MEQALATALVLLGVVLLIVGGLALRSRIWDGDEGDELQTQEKRESNPLT